MIRSKDIADLLWLEPWEPVGAQRGASLNQELRRELCPTHALAGSTCRAIATRIDRDDVLYVVDEARLAIVHLTWRREVDPRWPATTMISDLDAFVANHMRPDHEEFTT